MSDLKGGPNLHKFRIFEIMMRMYTLIVVRYSPGCSKQLKRPIWISFMSVNTRNIERGLNLHELRIFEMMLRKYTILAVEYSPYDAKRLKRCI